MSLWCAAFTVANGLSLVFLDDTYAYVRPWLSMAGVVAGIAGAMFGGGL